MSKTRTDYKEPGQPLPYRAEADVDRVVGKRRKTPASDPHHLESFPLALVYNWRLSLPAKE
jgi:hypothetical protein